MAEVQCTKCKKFKLIGKFEVRKDRPIGHYSHCKTCRNKEQKKRRRGKIESNRNVRKRRAMNTANYAQKVGKLIKPSKCEGCNVKTNELNKHHDNYNKPLEVDWLCNDCHSCKPRHC